MIEDHFDLDAWRDPQMARPTGRCSCCGREIYRPMQETCDRCMMDQEGDDD